MIVGPNLAGLLAGSFLATSFGALNIELNVKLGL